MLLAGRAGVAALEDQGAVTDDAADPLAAADDSDDVLRAAAGGNGGLPLAPAFEPDGMAQLESVDASADAAFESSLPDDSVDALTGMQQEADLTDTAAGKLPLHNFSSVHVLKALMMTLACTYS